MALTSVAELQSLMTTKISHDRQLPDVEHIPVAEAIGRVLAQNAVSSIDIPNANISAMDGYALPMAAKAGSQWVLAGASVAGKAFHDHIPSNGCVRIMTGAVVPPNCACVVLQEHVQLDEQHVTLTQDTAVHANIRYIGEEVTQNDVVLHAGHILRDADIMLLTALGFAKVAVYRKIKVAILSTGNELHEPGSHISGPDQIYDSNRHTLMARLRKLPVEIIDLGCVQDDLELVLHTLDKAAHMADVLISSGGVSVGDYDFMREAVIRLGAIHHYKVAIKPGKPFVFGRMFQTWYFGLPGNPVSGFVGFDVFLKAALWQLCGANTLPQPLRFKATLSQAVQKSLGRTDFQRVIIHQDTDGHWLAEPAGAQDSHRVWGVSRANAYIVLPPDCGALPVGATVTVQPFVDAFL